MNRWKPWHIWVLTAIVTIGIICCGVSVLASRTSKEPTGAQSSSPVVTTSLDSASSAPAAPTSPKAPAVVAIEDGTWTVGDDFPAGTYRVTTNISGSCYWSITKTGSNGEDIIANDIVSGGRPQVTLKKGQDFKTDGCGVWHKVK